MSAAKHQITPEDILSLADFERVRAQKYAEIRAAKQHRRVSVGPFATFYFESYDTMWWQVQEMLRIEGGGGEQLADELEAYNPLVPKGRELVATLMFEIDEPVRRARELGRLGGVEDTVRLVIDGDTVIAEPEQDVDRTSAAGKASSVQFVHFPLSDAQAEAFKRPGAEIQVRIDHPAYRHIAILSVETRAALAADLD